MPFGTIVSNVTGGMAVGQPTLGANRTLAITFSVDDSVAGEGANSTFLGMSVLASTQVCCYARLSIACNLLLTPTNASHDHICLASVPFVEDTASCH